MFCDSGVTAVVDTGQMLYKYTILWKLWPQAYELNTVEGSPLVG